MALILNENQIDGHAATRSHWIYNSLDCAITSEVADALLGALRADAQARRIYDFSMALQSPAIAIMARGIAIDPVARDEAAEALAADEAAAVARLAEIAAPHWTETEPRKGKCAEGATHLWDTAEGRQFGSKGRLARVKMADHKDLTCSRCGKPRLVAKGINPHSPPQMMKLLYGSLRLPEQHNHKTHKVSVDDECLDVLRRKFPEHADCINAVLTARQARKQLGLLRTKLDRDNRWRHSLNVGAAVTGRFSASKSPRWTGGNVQNVADRSRNIFVADPGLALFYADYEQAESRVVAHDAQDEAYIDAHATGDVHTMVTKLVWPGLPWPGILNCGNKTHAPDGSCCDRAMADLAAPFDPYHELRWYAKHIAHGSAIGMTPIGIARDAHVRKEIAEDAQRAYFRRFRRVKARQEEIIQQVRNTGILVTPLGRKRQFFGRLWDPATDREALAQTQQSMIVDWVSIALWRIWDEMDTELDLTQAPNPRQPNRVWLLGQIHDAVLGEVRWGDNEALARVQELMSFGMRIHGRWLQIPSEIKVGPTWRKDDMVKWKPGMEWPRW